MRTATLPFAFPLESAEILRRRSRILTRLCAQDEGFCAIPVQGIGEEALGSMLRLYDDIFLDGCLSRAMRCLHVTLSPRLTSSAGKFLCTRGAFKQIKSAEIRMSGDFLTRLDEGPFQLNGLSVATPQEAFLVVFEHELCHALETALYGQTGHSSRFLWLAKGLFGHTATRHSLPTRRQEAARDGLFVGSRVCFSFKGSTVIGVVTYIGKQATVMAPDSRGEYRDQRGRRYAKYRVPLERLKRIP
ncbi:MAG: hypothetical protein ACI4MP_12110 [Candidatus Ventricola sp.]